MLGWMEKRLVRYPVYVGFALLTFAVSVGLTFPDEQIKDIVVVEVEKALGSEYRVSIADLDLWWLTGVELDSVTIEERVSPGEAPEPVPEEEDVDGLPEDLPMKLTIPSLAARMSLLGSLFGGPKINFVADVGGGDVRGYFQQGKDGRAIHIDFDAIDLRKTTALTRFFGVPFFGELDGTVHLVLDPARPALIDGNIDLKGTQITIGPATVKTDKFPPITYLEIPQTNMGSLTIEAEVVESKGKTPPKLEFTDVEWSGRDMRGEVWGHLALSKNIKTTRPKVDMRMQLDETFVNKNSLGPLLNVAEVRKGKNKDWYGFAIYGRVGNLQFKGSPQAARGRPAEGAPEAPGPADEKE